MKAKVLKVLEASKSLIRDESKWWNESIQLNYCEKLCPIMAISHVTLDSDSPDYKTCHICEDILTDVSKMMGYICIVHLNASGSHATVMTMFDLAIQFLQDGLIQIKE